MRIDAVFMTLEEQVIGKERPFLIPEVRYLVGLNFFNCRTSWDIVQDLSYVIYVNYCLKLSQIWTSLIYLSSVHENNHG